MSDPKDDFEKKLEAKTKELEKLDENIDNAEKYRAVYDARVGENRTQIEERGKFLVGEITETIKQLHEDMDKKRERDFEELDKYREESQTLKTKYEKQIAYHKQVFANLPDDEEIVAQFVKDSMPKLEAMAISVRQDFPKPLKLDTKVSKNIKECFGKVEEDVYFSATGEEKPKYKSELEVEKRFKPERDRSSIYSIQVRPDGKAWVTTFNYRIYLILRTGQIYDEYTVSFLPIYTTINKYGQLYCSSAETTIHRVSKDYDIVDFADFAPFRTYGIHVTKDEKMLICLEGPQSESKVAVYSEMGMPLQEIKLDLEGEPIFKTPKFITQNACGQICVADDKRLIIVEADGKKHVKYTPTDDTWQGKSLIVDKFDNLISSECPLKIRAQNIHIMNANGENVKTFKLEGPKISGVNALCIDDQYDEPVLWIGTPLGDVIIAKFMHVEK